MKAVARHPPPEDSFCNDISSIKSSQQAYTHEDIFRLNDRNPEMECDYSNEIQHIKKWAAQPQSLHFQPEYVSKPDQPTVKKWKDRSHLGKAYIDPMFFDIGEQKKIDVINESFFSTNHHSIVLNRTTPMVAKHAQQTTRQNKSEHWRPNRIFRQGETCGVQMQIYKLQHNCILSLERLQSIQYDSNTLQHQISTLRRLLIQLVNLIGRGKQLELKFSPLVSMVENSLSVLSHLQMSIRKLGACEQATKSIVRNIYSVDDLLKLVKIVSAKKVLAEIKRMKAQFDLVLRDRKSYINRSSMIVHLERSTSENIEEISEVIGLFDERELRYNVRNGKLGIHQMLIGPYIQTLTDIQKESIIQLGNELQ